MSDRSAKHERVASMQHRTRKSSWFSPVRISMTPHSFSYETRGLRPKAMWGARAMELTCQSQPRAAFGASSQGAINDQGKNHRTPFSGCRWAGGSLRQNHRSAQHQNRVQFCPVAASNARSIEYSSSTSARGLKLTPNPSFHRTASGGR